MIADIGLVGLPNAGKSSLLKALTAAVPKIGNYAFTTLEPNLGVLQLSDVSSQLSDASLPVISLSETEKLKTDQLDSENRQQKTDNRVVIADIPGLVEGASAGRGLGIQFLKHIQKTKVLLHCIDATQENVFDIYQTVRSEFESYDTSLLAKKELILFTKTDLATKEQIEKAKKELAKTKLKLIPVSIYEPESIQSLKNIILNEVQA